LPDGIFSNQKSQFGQILEGHGMEDVVIFVTILSILLPFGIFYGHSAYLPPFRCIFSRFGMLHPEKSGSPVAD
jgi:hypothetical protein